MLPLYFACCQINCSYSTVANAIWNGVDGWYQPSQIRIRCIYKEVKAHAACGKVSGVLVNCMVVLYTVLSAWPYLTTSVYTWNCHVVVYCSKSLPPNGRAIFCVHCNDISSFISTNYNFHLSAI